MDHASRNRLTDRQLDRFPGKSLFDRIARVVCRAGCLPRKELYEAWEVARRVRRRFRGGRVVDLACGHGLLSSILLLLDDSSPMALGIDRAIAARARLAVLPCCHDLASGGGAELRGWLDGTLAMDVARAARLQAAGYRVVTQLIPAEITPKNWLLLAEPD